MRHARPADLDRLDGLLAELQQVSGLRERSRGVFTRGSRAFLHFHADGDDLYADVRLDEEFERHRVTDAHEQASLLALVRQAVGPG